MGWLDNIASTVAGWFDNHDTVRVEVPARQVFQRWMQQLALQCGGHLRWDADGAAELTFHLRGEPRTVVVVLGNAALHVYAPSNIRFRPGRLPPDVAEFLAGRNRKLTQCEWDAITNNRHSYFALKAHGRLDQIDFEGLKVVVGEMLAEVVALDVTLEEQGYVR